ncbi:MAG: hypothetical protein ACTTJ4_03165 [Treponema sp.]|uniref:hypothetical protein n=1 Tax=Treponema sp. TaxID=166 RepID=UPI003FA22CBD
MNKILKKIAYILCICSVLAVFGACKSQPEPQPEPQPVQPAEPEITPEQENAVKLLDELTKVRAQAVEVNADKAYPAEFQSADTAADEARSCYEAKDFNGAQEKAQRAILQYRTLINRTQIDALKAKINKHDLSAYDAETYHKAQELDTKIKQLYETDPNAAFMASEEALRCYESVTNAGFAALVTDAKKKADEAKERCDSLKAANAMKDAYNKTFTRYRQAGVLVGSQKYEQAYLSYMTAAQEFDDIYEKVKIKREQATNAMERAKARQEASSQLAKDADREAPLPENAEGFSEEPIEVEPLQLPAARKSGAIPAASAQREPTGQSSQHNTPAEPVQTPAPAQSQKQSDSEAPQQNTPTVQQIPEAQNTQRSETPAVNPDATNSQPVDTEPPADSSESAAPVSAQPAVIIEPIKTSEEAPQGTETVVRSASSAHSAAAEQNTETAVEKVPVQTAPAQPVTGDQE